MSIQISENQGMISVHGTLDKQNIDILNVYLSRLYMPAQRIVLNLERVIKIDTSAALALLKMFIKAVHYNSKFYIVGRNNETLLKSLRETNTLEIWNRTNNLK